MKSFIKNEDILRYLNKAKASTFIFAGLVLFFLLALVFIDAKENEHRDIVSVIGVTEERIYKDAQFSLDFIAYGISEEDAHKQIDEKVAELKGLINNFDQIVVGDADVDMNVECIVKYGKYYQAQDTGQGQQCLSGNWRAQARIKIVVQGDKYSEDIKKNFLSLAPEIVNATSGPVFIKKDLDGEFKDLLIKNAMANAESKARKMASESNKKLGAVVRIDEDPLVNNNLMSIKSEDKVILGPGEDLIEKKIEVEYELEK